MIIRRYEAADELQWLQCRVLAFLETAYFDDVYQKKETYSAPSIELVAIIDDRVVGLIDIEHQINDDEVSGMIWHVAVHPEHRRKGIAQALVKEAKTLAEPFQIKRFEAWTRDDQFVNDWYQSQGFKQIYSYYHIFPSSDEIRDTGILISPHDKAHPVTAYIHYIGDDQTYLSQFSRVHQCRRYDLLF